MSTSVDILIDMERYVSASASLEEDSNGNKH